VPLLGGIRGARSRVRIAAPFISLEVAEELARAALASGAGSRLLLTALSERAVRGGFLSPKGLRVLADAGFEIRSILNLHAKVALVDGIRGIVGSGNLTTPGLGGKKRQNLELGIGLTRSQSAAAEAIFEDWWQRGKAVDGTELAKYEAIAGTARGSGSRKGYGSFVYGDEPAPPRRRRKITGLWMKMLYHHPRRDQPDWWRQVPWVSDGRPPPSPQNLVNGPSYEVGDLLLLYLVEVGGDIRCCPAIAEVQSRPRHDPEFVRDNGFPGDEEQWPWVTDVEVLDSTSLDDAPGLEDIDVEPSSTEQHGRLILQPAQLAAARAAIAASP
jgi:PLD-like domain